VKIVYIVLGSVSLGLGILGVFLPVLPTTPFLLLTATLYLKGSPRLYEWLINHKYLGPYIRNYRENKAIPLCGKIVSVTLLWVTILLSAFLAVHVWWLRIVLICMAIGVTWHILSFKTLKNEDLTKQ
jgi:uncharacterized membrane protein YbaN (DUF454 family)